MNWLFPDEWLPTAFLFFPLWLGYILVVDGWVQRRSGTSMLSRGRRQFVLLFLASAPAWWLFEVINWRTRNWEYLGREHYSGLEYFILSSIAFSTVMPAVFGTAELVGTLRWTQRFAQGPRLKNTHGLRVGLFVAGLIMLALTLAWPRHFYPLVWGSVFLLIEPINMAAGRATLFEALGQGDWRPVLTLSLGALICGFFWEMWNYYGYPKWIYHTPGVEFLHVFEMPLLGYLGYIPFAWELASLRSLLLGPTARPRL